MTLTDYYNTNINTLNNYCDKYNIPQDYVSDTFMYLHQILTSTGLTENDYFQIIRKAIWKKFYENERRRNFTWVKDIHYKTTYFADISAEMQVEAKIREMNEWDESGKLHAWELEYLTRYLFQYIEYVQRYSEVEIFVFKAYAISNYTYRDIHNKFGISIDTAKNIMRKFRKDLRENFVNYVENQR